jgi:GT2 family glycosyltransferase
VDAWAEYRDTLAREVLPRIRHEAAQMANPPRISILVATYNPPHDMFHQMLESVRAQVYPHWELCVADDGSTQPHVRRLLDEYAAADPRIRVRYGEANRGVAHASNRALEMAQGSHVVLMDHDDLIEEHALFRVAQAIVEEDPDFFYSDEALVTHDRDEVRRYAFRPAFSLEYLRSHPYIVHLVGFRAELARTVGGFNEDLRISQDYDLVLRLVERARTITHLPEILYRWRIHGASAGIARQEQVMEVSRGVLQRHLQRCGVVGEARDGPSFNLFDIRYPLQPGLRVAIVIPTRNRGDLLKQCVDSIRRTVREVAYDIVVVDHESDEPATRQYLESIAAEVRILRHEGPFNFSRINNQAVARLAGAYTHYLFCNNDIEAHEEGWLERMVELGQHPDVGAVGALLFYGDRNTIQHAGVCVGLFGAAEHYGKTVRFPDEQVEPGFNELLRVNHEVAAVTAACMLMRRDCFEEIGGFDEQIAVGFGDVDLCLKAGQHGFRILFCPHARLIHHESATRGTSTVDPHPADSAYYRLKWKKVLDDGDPFYSPSLSYKSTRWALRRPLPCSYDIRRRVTRRDAATGRLRWMP